MAFRVPGIDLLRPLPLGSVPGVSPVFVVGMPRSGTTLLRLMLNAHPGLAMAGESFALRRTRRYGRLSDPEHLGRFVEDLTPLFRQQSPHPDLLEDPGLLASLAGAPTYAEALHLVMSAYAAREGKARWGEKTPAHVRHAGVIYRMFPEAKVVQIVRDPRAVIVSIEQTFGDGRFADADLFRLGRAWRRNIALLDRYDDGGPRYATIRYEDLVGRPEPTLGRLCEFLGTHFHPEMLGFHTDAARYARRDDDGTVNHAHTLTLQPLVADRAERWRTVLTRRQAAVIEGAAGDRMRGFGYGPVSAPADRPGRARRFAIVTGANAASARGRIQAIAGRASSAARRVGRSLRDRRPGNGQP